MGLGKTNKRKGSNAERYYVNIFKSLGYDKCVTARLGSRLHDNSKIDLINIPFNIQVKAGIQKGLNPGKELFMMQSSMIALFPSDDIVHTKPLILIHYKQGTSGKKRVPDDELVYMSLRQFLKFKEKDETLEFSYEKTYKFDLQSEFKSIVGMTFEYFRDNIILKQYQNVNNNTTRED